MTMHLVGPWLSTNGKKKGKRKWASAEQKREAERLEAEWQKLVRRHEVSAQAKATKTNVRPSPELPRSTAHIPSRDSGVKGAVTIKQTPTYTGDKIIGIGTMHKSNAVPIFSDDEAKAISSMRR